jgi:pimeloyl-ACP methyl ester carboxylesterase
MSLLRPRRFLALGQSGIVTLLNRGEKMKCAALKLPQLLEDVHKIRHIPTTIVQGRYDMVCPMRSAWDFHNAFPESELIVLSSPADSYMI